MPRAGRLTPTQSNTPAVQSLPPALPIIPAALWNGGPNHDPDPTAVIVTEQVDAGWNGQSGTVGSEIKGGTTTGNGSYQNYSATRYSVLSGSPSQMGTLTVHCTPYATVSSVSPANGESVGYANVGYTESAGPISLYVNYTTPDSNGAPNVMVGQVCTAGINGAPEGSISAYNWTVSGVIYQSWMPGIAPVTGLSNKTTPTETWWWDDPGPNPTTETAQCVITVGTTQATLTKSIIVQVPNITQTTITPGPVSINTVRGPLAIYAGSSTKNGMSVKATYHTPSPFSSTGQMELVQKITPLSSYIGSDGKNHPTPLSGQTGLDTAYPYGKGVQGGGAQPEPNFATNDSPSIPLQSFISTVSLSSTFTDWLMYAPPNAGNGVQYVPRGTYGWKVVSNQVTQPAGGWVDEGNASYGSVTLTPAYAATNQYPSWPQVIQAPSLPWPAGN